MFRIDNYPRTFDVEIPFDTYSFGKKKVVTMSLCFNKFLDDDMYENDF